MYLVTHLAVGAAIGAGLNNVPLSFIAGLVSHGILDMFPHHEYKKNLINMGLDILSTAVLLIILFILDDKSRWTIVAGALGGILPDLEHAQKAFKNSRRIFLFPTHNDLLLHGNELSARAAIHQWIIIGLSLILIILI